jgi:CheY-like chemotaxis protein
MAASLVHVLVIGEHSDCRNDWPRWLETRGCHCHLAASFQEACLLLEQESFDLVLSPFRLRDGTAHQLIGSLLGRPTTLFCSHPVERGSWWLPAVKNGMDCFGTAAIRSGQFGSFLDQVVKDIAGSLVSDMSLHSSVPRESTLTATGQGSNQDAYGRSRLLVLPQS